jgi:signal transduction histidine kinase/DNA-binding response OmpR family regulator
MVDEEEIVKKESRFKRIFFFVIFLLLAFRLIFTASQTGFKKYVENYRPKDSNQLWSNRIILQDKRGIIYAGNLNYVTRKGKLLQYDGVSWRSINGYKSGVYSMTMDDAGNIYIGGINEIGFLVPGSNGSLHYESLIDQLDENKKNFGYVYFTHSAKEGVYFGSSEFLFRWSSISRKIKVWRAKQNERFLDFFSCEGKLFINQENVGLIQMENDDLKTVVGGKRFEKKIIAMMVPYNAQSILIGTQTDGLYLFNGSTFAPFPTKVDDYLKDKQLAHGIRLSSSDFALATHYGGLVIIDSQGRLKEIFNKSYGLQDEEVHYVFEDLEGNVWLALEHGISKIEYASPISINDNLSLNIFSIIKHRNILYAGTERGLFSMTPEGKFLHVPATSGSYFSLLSIDDSIFAAASKGVFEIGNKTIAKINGDFSYYLLQSKIEPNRIWVGGNKGLLSLYKQNGQWEEEHKFEKITQKIETIVEDKKGNLWLGVNLRKNSTEKIVLKVDFPGDGTIFSPIVTVYDITPQVFTHNLIWVFMAAGHVIFSTEKGLFRFDEKNKVFIPDLTFGNELAGGSNRKGITTIVEEKNKNIWLRTKNRIYLAQPHTDGSYVILSKPFLRIQSHYWFPIYPDPDKDITWIGGKAYLIRYDMKIEKNYNDDFQALIRRVAANGNLVFGGYKKGIGTVFHSGGSFTLISYADRNLSFEFAAPFFEDETRTQYQCFLEGYENDWSALNWETRKDYTNLDPGLYTFRVRAQNVYGSQSSEAVFQFKILLPWYRTWWAFLSYAFVLSLITYLIVKWRRSIKLEQEKQKLEHIVIERTKEIKEKSRQLEQKTIQLEEQSEKLKEMDRVKSRFFANISHEFRTPLTLIMGPLEQMLSKSHEKEEEKRLNLMLRNSQRLLGLINQLLELSRLDSGKMKLQACRQNIIPFLKGIIASFEPAADENDLDLILHSEEENITLYVDPEKLEEVILNLLSNAVKFSPAGGKITITVHRKNASGADLPSNWLEVSVCDTGIGIPGEQLAHIFDRFYQSDSTFEHHQKGSGIGLAIAKELIELHHGEIEARSCEEKGTEFIIRIPMGDSHLKPEEIVEPGEKPYQHKNLNEIPTFYMIEKEPGSSEMPVTGNDTEPGAHAKTIILVVEDSPDVREYIRSSLEPLYTVVDAKDGEEGIKKAQEIIPDLIISDIMMPGRDGYALCRVLKNDARTSHIPLILLTARASEESIIQGLDTGADDYITKPFSTRILCARIKNLLDLRRQLQLKRKRQMSLEPMEISVSSMDEAFYKELQQVIEKNLSNSEFNVEQMGKKLYMSRATLYRKIMALTDESPQMFIRSYRLKRAAQLLKANYGNVNEVAAKVGFSKSAYFSQCFKEKFHQSPSSYQTSEAES